MNLVFPTLASFVVVAVLAAAVSGQVAWSFVALTLFIAFALYAVARCSRATDRRRIAVGVALGVAILLIGAFTRASPSVRPEWIIIGALGAMFVIRGRTSAVSGARRNETP
ncbi:MAG: hypothetical protein KDC38_02910 [Planctomycetes bacterium]|nr:hypothetical protein [Planctomycetota bacterium]